jgi:hypothetical protein
MVEDAGDKNRDGQQDGWNAQRVTQAVYRMLVAGSVLRDPLLVSSVFVTFSAQHADDNITPLGSKEKRLAVCQPFVNFRCDFC